MKYSTEFIKSIIKECKEKEFKEEFLPIRCAIVHNYEIEGFFTTTEKNHAEMIAIESLDVQNKTIVITHEPCPMCTFALCLKKINSIYFGSYNKLYGPLGGKFNMMNLITGIKKPNVFGGFDENNDLSVFFANRVRKEIYY